MKIFVSNIVHKNDREVIFSGRTEDNMPIMVKSTDPVTPSLGATYLIKGQPYFSTNKYGRRQRRVDTAWLELVEPSGKLCLPWLEALHGVGKVRAKRLLTTFGDDITKVLGDSEKVSEISKAIEPSRPNIGNVLAVNIQIYYIERKISDERSLVEWKFYRKLESLGITNYNAAKRLWRLIGNLKAEAIFMESPYLGAYVLPWNEVDTFARKLLLANGYLGDIFHHPRRLEGACDAAWQKLLAKGHTAASEENFLKAIPHGVPAKAALKQGLLSKAVIKDSNLLRAPGAAWLEDDLVKRLRFLANQNARGTVPSKVEAVNSRVLKTENHLDFILTEEQRTAICELLQRPLGVLQGGAGTGKTTTLEILIKTWESFGGETIICTIAGKAALQVSCATSSPEKPRLAYTEYRMIGQIARGRQLSNGQTSVTSRMPQFTSKTLVVIDEASIIDTSTLHQIVSIMPNGARLLLVGDNGQLSPPGIGSVFHDLVRDGRFVSNLTQVLRQAKDSQIPTIAAAIRDGVIPSLEAPSGPMPGVFHLECAPSSLSSTLSDIWEKLNCNSSDLTCAALNATVRSFNTFMANQQHEKLTRINHTAWIAPGIPVVCIQNRYQEDLFNGMLGQVKKIEGGAIYIHWDGENEKRRLTDEAVNDIDLAYAITCHRAQGSSARRVIVTLESSKLITREWLYTAITRAEVQVVLVGQKTTMEAAINRRDMRVTGFKVSEI